MLETYEPDWEAKWDVVNAEFRALETVPFAERSPDQIIRMRFLADEMCRLFDAGRRTPNDYLALHLPMILKKAESLGIIIAMPSLPDDAGIVATKALIDEIARPIQAEERQRSLADAMERAGLDYEPPPWWKRALPSLFEKRPAHVASRQASAEGRSSSALVVRDSIK